MSRSAGPDLELHIDGASRGNPGDAGFGVHATTGSGSTVAELYGYLGRATNNVAEYNGLIEALALASERGATTVEIFADSELLVKQIRGEYRVRHPDLKLLYAAAMRVIKTLDAFRIETVRRENNKEADQLVNVALNQLEADPDNPGVRIREGCGSSA